MKVQTSRFGVLEVEEEQILTFPEGVPGFNGRRYFLVPEPAGGRGADATSRWDWLQSVDEPEIAVLVVDPASILPAYPIEPKAADVHAIQPPDDGTGSRKLTCRLIARQGEKPNEVLLNLFAPLFFNLERRMGMQVPLVGSGYTVREVWPPRPAEPRPAADGHGDDAEA